MSKMDPNNRFVYKQFGSYDRFVEALNAVRRSHWLLHSWQDIGGVDEIDIRALFVQDASHYTQEFPEVKP